MHKVQISDFLLRLEQADLVEFTVHFSDMVLHRHVSTQSQYTMCIRIVKGLSWID